MPHESPNRLTNERVRSPWLSSSGTIAHPGAPRGGCGPGNSRIPITLGFDGNDSNPFAHPRSPVGRRIILTKTVVNRILGIPLANEPPKTKKDLFDVKRENTTRSDILVKGKVLLDGRDPNLNKTAQTRLDPRGVAMKFPKTMVKGGIVTQEIGKFTLKGNVTIQVVYDTNGSPKDPAVWGRGTTKEDIKNGDTTAGFHESCHLADYVFWLKTKKLPVFKGKVGISEDAYVKACEQFEKDWDKYFEDAEKYSEKKTDEVGKKKSQVEKN